MAVDRLRGGWGRSSLLVLAVVLAGATALLSAVAAITFVAYNHQSDRVDKVTAEYQDIEHDHMVIKTQFTDQSARLKRALVAMNRAYQHGFAVGRKAGTLPAPFGQLSASVRQGYVVPLGIPRQLRGTRPTVRRADHGYTVRWPSLALFASDREPLRDWTSKAWPRTSRQVRIGPRTVLRMVGPFGTVYAWRERNKTYAVVALPRSDQLVAPVVRALG
jgi:hypothetical protein